MISFNPVEVANNLQKNGGTILGYRPGSSTAAYIKKVLNRITLIGAFFLGVVAVLPTILSWINPYLSYLSFGGSSLLIVVGVVLETVRDMESQITMRHYKGFLG
jgi:preprotein translocase subunit SecY